MFKNRFLIGAGGMIIASSFCLAQCQGHAQLNQYERGQFLEVAMGLRSEVFAQFLAETGCGTQMFKKLRSLGTTVRYADEKSGYALVVIPKDKLLDVLDIAGIDYAYVRDDDRMYYQDPEAKVPQDGRKTEPVPIVAIPYPSVAKTLSSDGPYFAADAIGLPELWKQHPEADGRGVTVAVLDEGVDLLHPALLEARDADGHIVPKVADQISLNSPDQDSNWVRMDRAVEAPAGVFEAAGRTWTAPRPGTYEFGIYKRDLVLGPEGNSRTKKLSLSVGVLWNVADGHVWVDTDGDGSFKNQRALRDYGANHEIDWFGTKEGNNDNRIPFGVKINREHHAIFLSIAEDGHGAWISGSLAANRMTAGLYDGAAPGAQLIDARYSRLMLLSLMFAMEARPDVAVLSRSGGFARAIYEGLQAGIEDFQRHVAERMVRIYSKPLTCVCVGNGIISVNDYVSGEMLRRNRQTSPPYVDAVHDFYSASRAWGLVNGVIAPSANLGTESRYMPEGGLLFPDMRKHTFSDDHYDPPAPAGYSIGANESPTVPVVSGVLADMIGEARREHVRYDVARLDQAVFAGARLINGIPMYEQGYGLINAAGAWEQLVRMAKADDPTNPVLTSFTFSEVKDGSRKNIDGYYRETTKPGGAVEDEIWVTRHGGYAGGRIYAFALRGDDGTYTLLTDRARLKPNQPVKIRFRATVTSGFHVAMVELTDAATGSLMQLVPLSLKVPDTPEVLQADVDQYTATMAPRRDDTRLIYLDEDVQAVRYHLQIPYERNDGDAYGPGIRGCGGQPPTGGPMDAAHHVGPIETCDSLVPNEGPGFQYVGWENRAFDAEYETPYDPPAPTVPITGTVTVTKYAVAFAKKSGHELTVSNRLAEIDGRTELYDANFATSELHGNGKHSMAEAEYEMPSNLAQWRAWVTGVMPGTHTDAYLFNCTNKNGACSIVSQQQITYKGALLVVDNPQAGVWKLIICTRERVSGNAVFKLTEAQLTPTQTNAPEANRRHSSGEKWTVVLPDTTQYAAFRIAGTPGVEHEKDGLVIAMTPLDRDDP